MPGAPVAVLGNLVQDISRIASRPGCCRAWAVRRARREAPQLGSSEYKSSGDIKSVGLAKRRDHREGQGITEPNDGKEQWQATKRWAFYCFADAGGRREGRVGLRGALRPSAISRVISHQSAAPRPCEPRNGAPSLRSALASSPSPSSPSTVRKMVPACLAPYRR